MLKIYQYTYATETESVEGSFTADSLYDVIDSLPDDDALISGKITLHGKTVAWLDTVQFNSWEIASDYKYDNP